MVPGKRAGRPCPWRVQGTSVAARRGRTTSLFANAPGPRVSPAHAQRLGDQVPAGAHVTIELVSAGAGMAHGLAVMPAGAARSAMPMMTAAPSFSGAALWFLGRPTAAGMHAATMAFTATAPGSYQYLCPVPGHAQQGMAGTFAVR